MVGEQRHDILVVAEDVFDEPVQCPLGAHLDKHSSSGVIQCLETLHELHGRGHLLAENVEHRVSGGIGGVELSGHVGDEGNLWWADIEPSQR